MSRPRRPASFLGPGFIGSKGMGHSEGRCLRSKNKRSEDNLKKWIKLLKPPHVYAKMFLWFSICFQKLKWWKSVIPQKGGQKFRRNPQKKIVPTPFTTLSSTNSPLWEPTPLCTRFTENLAPIKIWHHYFRRALICKTRILPADSFRHI